MPHFLGLDYSTQQLKATILDDKLKVVHKYQIDFDNDLPLYNSKGGVHNEKTTNVVTAPTLMWTEATDLLLDKMKRDGFDFSSINALSGAAQQHGSVYWRKGALEMLQNFKLNPDQTLVTQLKHGFSLSNSPVWMDSSTTEQCRKLETQFGGVDAYAQLTGSKLYERFTGPQILKLIETQPAIYEDTEHISLVSNFAASLFLGQYAPMDKSDGCGTALFDIKTGLPNAKICEFIANDLTEKIGPVSDPYRCLGSISSYFVERYGFSSECQVVVFTGDNPSSLAGMRLKEGDICISLGTSDVLVFWRSSLPPVSEATLSTVFVNPVKEGAYMSIVCYKNGSLPRTRLCNELSNCSWQQFESLLQETPIGNSGYIGLFYDDAEITPQNVHGTYFWDASNNTVVPSQLTSGIIIRALIEGQFLAKRAHLEALGIKLDQTSRILATGGASQNKAILQTIADIFGASVFTADVENSAAAGAAYRAKHGILGGCPSVDFLTMVAEVDDYKLAASPTPNHQISVYAEMVKRYRELEKSIS